jgi:hypothetical protein
VSSARLYFLRPIRQPLGIFCAQEIDLYFASARNPSVIAAIPAALRVDHIVPITMRAEDGDLHILDQAGVLPFEIGRTGSLNLENRAVLVYFFEAEAVGES